MKLSNRLKAVSELIKPNSFIYDVGCDHGLLDIYLTKYKGCKCVAIDVNKKCISKTLENTKLYNTDIEVLLNDGLSNIDIVKNSTVVILGMGTFTIKHIYDNCNISNIDTFIIQSNNDLYSLRKFMSKSYFIEDEIVVVDKNKIYVIIKFKKGFKKYKYNDYLLGPILKLNKNSVVYYDDYIKILNKQINNLHKSKIYEKIKLKYKRNIIKKQRNSLLI